MRIALSGLTLPLVFASCVGAGLRDDRGQGRGVELSLGGGSALGRDPARGHDLDPVDAARELALDDLSHGLGVPASPPQK